jgi:DNA-binding transcriptional LysR family regulator
MAPAHLMLPLIEQGELVALNLQRPFAASPSCVAWNQNKHSPAMAWLLDYLGDAETMNQEWLNGALIVNDER